MSSAPESCVGGRSLAGWRAEWALSKSKKIQKGSTASGAAEEGKRYQIRVQP